MAFWMTTYRKLPGSKLSRGTPIRNLGSRPRWGAISARNKPSEEAECFTESSLLAVWNHKPIRRRQIVRLRPAMGCVVHKNVEYTAKKFQKSWQGRVQSWR
jgi:hypothetical protein